MPINQDIMNIGGGEEVIQEFSPNFFQSQMSLQEEDHRQDIEKRKHSDHSDELSSDWMTFINRMFMKGMNAQSILNAVGKRIESLENSEEVLKYIKKYEGLIGTIFLDSKVLESGFPMALIPKSWAPYHRYSIHCSHPIVRHSQKAEGGLSGDIDMFLSSSDKNVRKEEEFCSISNLPVLKAGMFNEDVISKIMESLGKSGNKLSDLQAAMKEIALKINSKPKEQMEFEKPDTKFELQNQKLTIAPQKETKTEISPIKYNLRQNKINAKISKSAPVKVSGFKLSPKADIQIAEAGKQPMNGIRMEYKKSSKKDIVMTHIPKRLNDVKVDEELRY